jgi:hypothetical protein
MSPGGSAIITINGNLVMSAGSTFVVDLNALLSFDRVAVNGTLNLGGRTLTVTDNFGSATGNSFNIIPNDEADAIVETFAGLPEGATFSVGGSIFSISYVVAGATATATSTVPIGAVAIPTLSFRLLLLLGIGLALAGLYLARRAPERRAPAIRPASTATCPPQHRTVARMPSFRRMSASGCRSMAT